MTLPLTVRVPLILPAALACALVLAPATARAQSAGPPDTLAGPPSRATRTAPAQRRSGPSFTLAVGVERFHDDNILQLTPRDLDRFAANPTPPRFLITSPDDDVTEFHGDGYARLRVLRRRDTRLGVSVDASVYQRNSVKDWHQFGFSLMQELSASRKNLTSVTAWWRSMPDFYLLQITDDDDSFAAGFRIRRSLTFSQTTTGVRVDQELLGGRVEVAAGFERARRDYNDYFNERDNHNDEWRVAGEARPFPGWGASARVTVLVGALHAHGDLASSPIRDNDISYDHHGVGGSISLPWSQGPTRGHFDLSLMPETRVYQTTDKFDLNRFGRTNHRLETQVRVTQRVWGPFDAVATYEKLRSDASFDAAVSLSEEQTNFDQQRAGVMLRARWEFRAR